MARSEKVCYGCIRNVDISHQDGVYRLEKSTIRILEPLLRMRELEFGLTISGSNDSRLNIYGPKDNKLVGQQLEDSNVSLQDPLTVRPGLSYKNAQRTHYAYFMLDQPIIVHNLWDSAPEMNDVQSWSVAEVRRMKKDSRRVSRHFYHFKRLPAEIRCMITAQLTAHEVFNFLRSHKGAQNDVMHTNGRAKAIWDRWFAYYSWLDKMVTRGFQPALIGTPYRSKDHKKIHLALVLIGQNETMDWTQDSRELIQTLRCQEGNAYAAIIENESLHIGQPFGKTELQRHPNLNDSLRGSAFHTNRQLSALKRRGKTIEEWNAQTFILYYEPLKPEPHPGTGLHVTTAVIQTFSSSFQVRDAKQPKISWHFEEPGLAGNDPLLPEGRVKTHSGYSLEKMTNKVGDRPNT